MVTLEDLVLNIKPKKQTPHVKRKNSGKADMQTSTYTSVPT